MNKIPTAEEFLLQKGCSKGENDSFEDVLEYYLTEFAKLHVEAALKAASSVLDVNNDADYIEHPTEERIIATYPLENIK